MRLFAIITATAMLTLPTLAGDLSPALIHQMLTTQSPTVVVQSIDTGDEENNPWFGVLDHIERGEQDWLDLVPLLAPGTDAGTAEALVITLSRGLKANPAAILHLLLNHDLYSIADICMDNDIEVSDAEVAAFIDAAIAAVTAITNPTLSDARAACLAQLATTRPAL